jgi:hypothetical protein
MAAKVTPDAVARPPPKKENGGVMVMVPVPGASAVSGGRPGVQGAASQYLISPAIVVRTQDPPGLTCMLAGHAEESVLRKAPPLSDNMVKNPVNANLYCAASACIATDPPSTAATAAATPLALNVFE